MSNVVNVHYSITGIDFAQTFALWLWFFIVVWMVKPAGASLAEKNQCWVALRFKWPVVVQQSKACTRLTSSL